MTANQLGDGDLLSDEADLRAANGDSLSEEADGGEQSMEDLIHAVMKNGTIKKLIGSYRKCLDIFLTTRDEDMLFQSFSAMKKLLEICLGEKIGKKKFAHKNTLDKSMTPNEVALRLLTLTMQTFQRSFKGSRVFWHTYNHLSLISNCLVDIITTCVKEGVAYALLYKLVRNCSEDLRVPYELVKRPKNDSSTKQKADEKKLQDMTRKIHSWSFVYTFKISIAVLNTARINGMTKQGDASVEDNMDLLLLGYPIYNILKASLDLNHGKVTLLPFHLHILRLLVNLQECTQQYVPLTMPLMVCVAQIANAMHNTKPLTKVNNEQSLVKEKGIIYTAIRVPNTLSTDASIMDDCWDHIMTSVTLYYGCLCLHPSFPELIDPIIKHIKSICSKNNVPVSVMKRLQAFSKLARTTAVEIEGFRDDISLDTIPAGVISVIPYVNKKYQDNSSLYKERIRVVKEEADKMENYRTLNTLAE